MAAGKNALIGALEEALLRVTEAEAVVTNLPDGGQSLLYDRINWLVEALQKLEAAKDKVQGDINIPAEVLQMIDNGLNPDLHSRDIFSAAAARNQATKGRVEALLKFHAALQAEASAHFPVEARVYAEIEKGAAKDDAK